MTDPTFDNIEDVDFASAEFSDETRARRDAILNIAIGQMNMHHRRLRHRRRLVATSAAMITIALLTIFAVTNQRNTTPAMQLADETTLQQPASPQHDPEQSAPDNVQFVRSDSTVLDKYVVRTPHHMNPLTDTELVELLAAIDRPTGLINMDGQVRLTNHVIDLDTNENDDDPNGSPSL